MKKQSTTKKTGLFLLQFTLLSIVAIIFVLVNGWLGLKSTLLGGIAWIIPSLYFSWKLHKIKTLFDSKEMLKSFLWGEATKMLLSFMIIICFITLFTVDKPAFLSGFVSSVLGFIIENLRQGTKNASS